MKAVILCGGLGTRLREETEFRPKPMVPVGGRPILWHIMKIYAHYGHTDFVICLGYKGYLIKEYFANYFVHNSDITIELHRNRVHVHQNEAEPWTVTMVDTGDATMTGGRLKRIRDHVGDRTCFMTYGDGVADIDLTSLLKHHRHGGRACTVTAIRPPGRYGVLQLQDDGVEDFHEKPAGDGAWINGGFFALEPEVFDYVEGDHTPFEGEPMQRLVADRQMNAFRHQGFWQAMDTLRDKRQLEALWSAGKAPWKVW